ncbi:hypothetical protein A3762_19225 [Oleiphilus sp. HI0125]|nr:hypothetical protein A3762_19225 [Oleiphilus sp. HI0125]
MIQLVTAFHHPQQNKEIVDIQIGLKKSHHNFSKIQAALTLLQVDQSEQMRLYNQGHVLQLNCHPRKLYFSKT